MYTGVRHKTFPADGSKALAGRRTFLRVCTKVSYELTEELTLSCGWWNITSTGENA